MPRRRPVVTPNVWRVSAFEQSLTALQAARGLSTGRRPLSLITAPAGSGKTFSAEWFAQHNPGVKLAVCPPRDLLTAKTLLHAVAHACGIEPQSFRRNSDLFDNLAESLAGTDSFLIVDEADRLLASNADLLRELAETSNTAVCYLGCPAVRAVLARVPATHHRIGLYYSIPPVELEDVRQILFGRFEENVIEAIFDQTQGNLRHLEALLTLLERVETKRGAAQISVKIVKTVASQYLMGAAA